MSCHCCYPASSAVLLHKSMLQAVFVRSYAVGVERRVCAPLVLQARSACPNFLEGHPSYCGQQLALLVMALLPPCTRTGRMDVCGSHIEGLKCRLR